MTLDTVLSADHFMQGNIEGGVLTLAPFTIGHGMKKAMKINKNFNASDRELGGVIMSSSSAAVILGVPK